MQPSEILPCPFCGSENFDLHNTHTPAFWVECEDCGAQAHGDSIGDAAPEGEPFSYSNEPAGPFEAPLWELPMNYQAAASNAIERWNRRAPITAALSVEQEPDAWEYEVSNYMGGGQDGAFIGWDKRLSAKKPSPAQGLRNLRPLYAHPPTPVSSPRDGWLPIEQADKDIAYIHDLGEMKIGNSYPVWVRDEDGRVYEALWSDNGKKAYWWDIEGESPVDPVEFMPHPLDNRFSASFPAAEMEGK